MRWPWVSRKAYDAAVEERDSLGQRLNKALMDYEMLAETIDWVKANYYPDHWRKLDRIEVGVTIDPKPITGARVNLMRARSTARYVERTILRQMEDFERQMRERESQ